MRVLVTGGNAGIGYFAAEQLASAGAEVVIGSRDPAKAEAALASIRSQVAGAKVRHVRIDLADLASLEAVDTGELDAVVCNAGVALDHPPRRETADGHELMFGTNHLGHFALVARLMPVLAPAARIVTTGSFAAKSASLDFADLQSERDYQPKRAYERSKLAQMLFALELDRRLRAAGSQRLSVLAHPGGALDSLTPSRPRVHTRTAGQWLRGRPAGVAPAGQGRRRAARRPRGARPGRHRRAAVGPAGVRPARPAPARTALGEPGRRRGRHAGVGGKCHADRSWTRLG